MARFSEFTPLYDAFQSFLQSCILEDRSLLWPRQNLWTPGLVSAVKQAIIDNPAFGGERGFEEKLQEQMKSAPTEGWGILADIYYVYYLPTASVKTQTKQRLIAFAAEQGGFTLPEENDPIWLPLGKGFSNVGFRYNLKYSQFWAILLFAHALKGSQDRDEILRNPQRFQNTIDSALETITNKADRGVDMRHAMLYLAFPDHYEPIISTQDKRAIIITYGNIKADALTDDLDQIIYGIRQDLSPEKDREGIPFNFYRADIKAEWKEGKVVPPLPPPPLPPQLKPILGVKQALKVLEHTRNLILYGPPGTGKTFLARKLAEELVVGQVGTDAPDRIHLQQVAESHPFYDVIALGLYLAGSDKSYSVSDIRKLPLIQSRFQIKPVTYQSELIWRTLQSHSDPNLNTVHFTNRTSPALFDKVENSRWKLIPGGKEYVEQTLADVLGELRGEQTDVVKAEDFISSVTFHQSYSYEDFIEGIRPKESGEETNAISYEVTPGIFLRVCTRAAADPTSKYVFLIDEINRGNIAKIFGELITLIEDDKRGGQTNVLNATLPYSGKSFNVPDNIYLVGTMNTADRSIALLDVALRRRFAFMEVMPDPDLLEDECVVSEEGVSVHLGDLLRSLNTKILERLDRNHQIGHSYLLKVRQAPPEQRVRTLEFVWNFQIFPLLEEYFYSQRARLLEILTPFVGDLEKGTDPETIEIPKVTGDDLIRLLMDLSKTT